LSDNKNKHLIDKYTVGTVPPKIIRWK